MGQARTAAILVAAGGASRLGFDKILLPLGGRPAVLWSLLALEAAGEIDDIAVVTAPERLGPIEQLALSAGIGKLRAVVPGGATRQQSVRCGAEALPEADFYAVHDAARPLVTPDLIDSAVRDAKRHGAAALAVPVKDTVKLADAGGFIGSTPPRERLWICQTPQAMRADWYYEGYNRAAAAGADYTDDCQLLEAAAKKIFLTMGSYDNFKITTPEDVPAAEAALARRERGIRP